MFTKILAVLVALYIKAKRPTTDVALLLSQSGDVLASAHDTRTSPCVAATAVVNLLRAVGEGQDGLDGTYIASTAEPTVMDTGMCRLTGVKAVLTLQGSGLVAWRPADSTGAQVQNPEKDALPKDPKLAEWTAQALGAATGNGSAAQFVAIMEECPDRTLRTAIQRLVSVQIAVPGFALPPPPPAQGPLGRPGDRTIDAFWLRIAKQLTGIIHGPSNTNLQVQKTGHNIGCVLVSAHGNALAWGVNTNAKNPTRHAETNCVHMFQFLNHDQALPQGATLYTTLQSCYMCSGMIKHASGNHAVRVVYGEADKVARSVLTDGEGAREVSALTVKALGHGERMLAAARWERLRRTLVRDGKPNVANIKRAAGPTREDLDSEIRRTRDQKLKVQKQAVSARLTEIVRAHQTDNAARDVALRDFGKSPDKRSVEVLAGLPFLIPLGRLQAARLRVFALEEEGKRAVGVGAPVLLMTDSARQQLQSVRDEMPARPEAERTSDNVHQDINTASHGMALLAQVRSIADAYRTM